MQKGRTKIWFVLFYQLMRNVGLEPTRLAAQEPKSCMSANSISSAHAQYVIIRILKSQLQNFQHTGHGEHQHQ